MQLLWKVCLAVIAIIVLVLLTAAAWLYFDSRGLPDPQSLAPFAPKSVATVSDPCLKSPAQVIAIPYDSIGSNMRTALSAAEASEDDPGVMSGYYRTIVHREGSRAGLSDLIGRTMFCQPHPGRTINHHLDSLRLAVQIERRYSHREMFTIFANRIYFGEGQYGVEAASQHFFHKEPSQLLIQEAALLAGMPKSPARLSPRTHPDLALERRNEVIGKMAAVHSIREADASAAKAIPLSIMSAPEFR